MLKIKDLRLNAGLSQVEFAKKLNVAQNTVSNWENTNRLPDIETVIKIADYFNVSVDYLLGIEEKQHMPDEPTNSVEFTLDGEAKGLTDEQKQEVLEFIRFKKQQEKSDTIQKLQELDNNTSRIAAHGSGTKIIDNKPKQN